MIDNELTVEVINHTKSRDLPTTVSVSNYLHCVHGHDVTIFDSFVNSSAGWEWARRVQPDVIVFPKIIDPPRFLPETEQYRFAEDYDPYCVVMPTERESPAEDSMPLQGVDLFLAWNTRHAAWAKEHYHINKEAIEVVGCPRYDLFAETNWLSARKVNEMRQSYDVPVDWDGHVLTVASSFPLADHFLYDREKLEHRIEVGEQFGWGEGEEIIEYAEALHETREEFIALIRTITETFPDMWVLLKTHPTEKRDRYEERLTSEDRVSVVPDDYSARYLQTSDLHIHHNCTTGIEAFMLEVPSVNYLPLRHERIDDSEKGAGSFKIHSASAVLELIEALRRGGIQVPPKQQTAGEEYVNSQFTAVDGNRAKVAAETIDDHLSAATVDTHTTGLRGTLYTETGVDTFREPDESVPEYIKKVLRSVKKTAIQRPTQTGRPGGRLPRLVSDELNSEDVKDIEELLGLPGIDS